jgi:hypothetical protein
MNGEITSINRAHDSKPSSPARNRLEMFRFKAIFAFAESFCHFKILGRVLDHNRDTIGLFSLTHLCGKLRCAQKWIIHFGSN